MEKYYMNVNLLMVKLKEMESLFMKMVHLIQANIKIILEMGKEYFIIQMEKLIMKVIGAMVEKMDLENLFMKMINIIIQVNGKMI